MVTAVNKFESARWTKPGVKGYMESRVNGFVTGLKLEVVKLGGGLVIAAFALSIVGNRGQLITLPLVEDTFIFSYKLLPRRYLDFLHKHKSFWSVVHGPIHEELFFRGAVQGATKMMVDPFAELFCDPIYEQSEEEKERIRTIARWVAIVPTALMFGLIHRKAAQQIQCVFAGLRYGYWKEESDGNLAVSIGGHMMNNGIVTGLELLLK